jgi:hypothetical protein
VECTPASQLIEWIEYCREKERREQARLVEALALVVAKVFPKEE